MKGLGQLLVPVLQKYGKASYCMSHALDKHDGGQRTAKRTRYQEVSRAEVAERLQDMGRQDIQTWEGRFKYRSRKETLKNGKSL